MSKEGPETRLIKKMKAAAKTKYGHRIVVIKYHGGPFTEAGVPDLLICLDGVFIGCEVKAPENYGNNVERAARTGTSVKQEAFLNRIAQSGGIACVMASVEGFMAMLDEVAK